MAITLVALAVLAKRMKGRKTMDLSLDKMTLAADKLGASKPKRKRHKKSTRKSAKRVRAAKKGARTKARKHAKRLPSFAALQKKHKTLIDRKLDLDYRYSVKKTITRKQYLKAFRPLVKAIKKAESALRGGKFNW